MAADRLTAGHMAAAGNDIAAAARTLVLVAV